MVVEVDRNDDGVGASRCVENEASLEKHVEVWRNADEGSMSALAASAAVAAVAAVLRGCAMSVAVSLGSPTAFFRAAICVLGRPVLLAVLVAVLCGSVGG